MRPALALVMLLVLAAVSREALAAKPAALPVPAAKEAQAHMRAYRGHLLRGRALARQKKWGEAIPAFQAALREIPMDGRALTDLGWAAFNAGDLALAAQSNAGAVKAATSPQEKAAALYNLGRVAEAQKDLAGAARHYNDSLLLRKHPAVEARLKALGRAPVAGAQLVPSPPPCAQEKATGPQSLCACLVSAEERQSGKNEDLEDVAADERCKVEALDGDKQSPRLRLARLKLDRTTDSLFLLFELAGTWRVVAAVGLVYNPGAFGISEDMTTSLIETGVVKGRPFFRIESEKYREDQDMGINEVESTDQVTLYLVVAGEKGPAVFRAPLKDSYDRGQLILNETEDADGKDLEPKVSPRAREVRAVLDPQTATLQLTLIKGAADNELKPYLGAHPLALP